ncbi:MAG TPA: DUF1802 family protein [Chthoniobacterales bacterium]|nr:DUF1802 family protein [Chthoniobacterales bacterium]
MESAGLKEWALVCQAMGRGEQSIIVRKGGLAEGREGFAFRHSEFFLFPTFFHEQLDKVRVSDAEIPKTREGEIEIHFFAQLIAVTQITSWATVAALEPLHILQPAVVRERFDYDKAPGLHVALVRVFRLAPAWILPDAPRYGGCRSWVPLPDYPPEIRFEPVLTEAAHDLRVKEFRRLSGLAPI